MPIGPFLIANIFQAARVLQPFYFPDLALLIYFKVECNPERTAVEVQRAVLTTLSDLMNRRSYFLAKIPSYV